MPGERACPDAPSVYRTLVNALPVVKNSPLRFTGRRTHVRGEPCLHCRSRCRRRIPPRCIQANKRHLTNANTKAAATQGWSALRAYEQLRDAIMSGELPAGARLSQVALANRFGVSRTPLREAVRRLQSEGLLDSEHNRQVRVAGLDLKDLENLYDVHPARGARCPSRRCPSSLRPTSSRPGRSSTSTSV